MICSLSKVIARLAGLCPRLDKPACPEDLTDVRCFGGAMLLFIRLPFQFMLLTKILLRRSIS